ncbi:rhamnan synthesis F family protein [uncultured Sphingomonas sp.]|uniref:rhamnan synthesis F family protein n=1 Tax=uncultured Sphingomonas sp. TaxID=158754 RepID=UPI0025D8F7CA|nr:rhamnan synthesis F family protein [uncultured Sphingomonas sp.]
MIGYVAARTAKKARREGNRARDAHRWADAAAAYRRYLAIQPDDAAIRIQLGHALSATGDYHAADTAYRQAAERLPDDADLLLCWGHSRKLAGDNAAARDLYARSHAIDANADAAREIGTGDDRPPEPAEAGLPDGDLPEVGRIERVEGLTVLGLLTGGGEVEFRHHGRPVARAQMEEGKAHFRAPLDLYDDVQLSVHRLPDGAELDGSPFNIGPPRHHAPAERRAWSARFELVKPFDPAPESEVALFVTHSATGALKPHVLPYVQSLAAQGIAVFVIAVTDRPLNIRPELIDAAAGVMIRENIGFDFAAWAHVLQLHPELYGAPLLYLANDSLIGPSTPEALGAVIARVRASDADLVGLTESHEYRWHVQTFFLGLKPRLLASFRLQRFFDEVKPHTDKDAVIRDYEVSFAERMEQAGHRTEILFPSKVPLNPTLFGWRALIAEGFPFIKALLLRGAFPDADVTGWRDVLADAGFDLPTVDATLLAAAQQVPREEGDHRLSAHPVHWDGRAAWPLKVAFYGPWNYDNGLGAASRNMIAALRHSGVRLNLHPIKTPFHIHRPIDPPVDVREFGGPADVAIVHLNPDSWFMLTDDQRRDIWQAHRRIGYWVWEMGHLPDGWRRDFSSVDRIWTPSTYCAEVFAAEDEAPVDVIPHVVPLPVGQGADRAETLASLGLPADRRIMLYVFDGASYLVRKNPAALVRAFAASGLAAQGWTLVLKTKNLMDRPDEGQGLRDLVRDTPEVALLDRGLSPAELDALVAAADLYASPHCSEGFGLTIAEAMARGTPVVATDFGGSTDFVDDGTGYPVKARLWRLDRDHGHYAKGGTWGRVDEPALTAALIRAADDVAQGDTARVEAAKARVAERFSAEAVGTAIRASLWQLTHGRGRAPAIDRLHPRFSEGVPFEDGALAHNVHAVTLDAGGRPRAQATGVPADVPAERHHWVAFAPAGSLRAPHFAQAVLSHARERRDVAIFYADDVAGEVDEAVDALRLKPDFDLTLLAAQDYVGAPVIVRASALASLGGLRPEMGSAAVADLLFRAHAAGLSVARLPDVLIGHVGKRVRATLADYRAMLKLQPQLVGWQAEPGRTATSLMLGRRFDDGAPPLTIAVPTRRSMLPDGSRTYLERLLDGIAAADWPMEQVTVLVGDDVPGEPDWAKRPYPFTLRRRETLRGQGEPFNYAAKMNQLWRAAETEQLLFINDDVQPTDAGWLKALMSFAVDRTVGGVGARLLFEDGTLQHAGFGPHNECAAHVWVYRRRAAGTYQGWALTQREWSMVTGAVFATRRSLMEEVGGFDEAFTLEYNDTDLCLRLRLLGYRIVYNPAAELIHTEKASRGERLPPGDTTARFLARWKPWIDNDPSWHPGLRRDRIDVQPRIEGEAWYR